MLKIGRTVVLVIIFLPRTLLGLRITTAPSDPTAGIDMEMEREALSIELTYSISEISVDKNELKFDPTNIKPAELRKSFCFGITNGVLEGSSLDATLQEEFNRVSNLRKNTKVDMRDCLNALHQPIIPSQLPSLASNVVTHENETDPIWVVVESRDQSAELFPWIAHLISLGVQHVLVLDNESGDKIGQTLQPWVNTGLISIISWPGKGRQTAGYAHASKIAKHAGAAWLGALDVDEWVVLGEKYTSLNALLADVPSTCGSLQLNWFMAGSERMYKERSVLKPYTSVERAKNSRIDANIVTKGFTRLKTCKKQCAYPDPHRADVPECNSKFEKMFSSPFQDPPLMQNGYIIHRYKGSLEGWLRKGIRGSANKMIGSNAASVVTSSLDEAIKIWLSGNSENIMAPEMARLSTLAHLSDRMW